ncbi:MAG: GNAT family protein [Saprospiraceae bacterium]|nr:GNAT family protein [Saprospiraceae bacterium]
MHPESERIRLLPLNYEDLILYLQGDNKLERSLKLAEGPRMISPELIEAFHETILMAVADSDSNYLFSTLWNIVDKSSNQMVGDLCFKGEPNEKGEIEIGYGVYPPFAGMGYMTEAIRVLLQWAFGQPGVETVIAETESTNIASHRTLEKNDFRKYKVEGEMYWWRCEKK